MKKYELTEETKTRTDSTVLYRIRALLDIPRHCVKAGDLGGWVEKENNLSQYGDAWVSGNAKISGDARVYGNAWVSGNAEVSDNAKIFGKAWVSGNAWVYGNACVSNNAKISGDACVSGNAEVSGNANIIGNAWVDGDAKVSGNACVSGNAWVDGDAKVSSNSDYMVVKNTWSSGRWFTYTRSNKMWKDGSFYGTGEELIAKAYKDSELSGRCYETIVRAVETIEAVKAEAEGDAK